MSTNESSQNSLKEEAQRQKEFEEMNAFDYDQGQQSGSDDKGKDLDEDQLAACLEGSPLLLVLSQLFEPSSVWVG